MPTSIVHSWPLPIATVPAFCDMLVITRCDWSHRLPVPWLSCLLAVNSVLFCTVWAVFGSISYMSGNSHYLSATNCKSCIIPNVWIMLLRDSCVKTCAFVVYYYVLSRVSALSSFVCDIFKSNVLSSCVCCVRFVPVLSACSYFFSQFFSYSAWLAQMV